jgi:GTPase Era involved in 16S rRNA processing
MKSNYKNIIHEISQINRTTGAPDLTRPIESLLSCTDEIINIAVLGQFKSGKSSLINSIIGEDILPVGVVPVTAIVTQLKYDTQPGLKIQFNDGSELLTALDQLPTYVTEKQNPENIKNVGLAIVAHPALEPYSKISFIDTPGLGSFYRHNTDTTLQWLPYIGVAIISVSAERPLSEEDIQLIKGIARYCPDVILVITKTDLFNANELDEIKTFITKSIKQALNREKLLFDYSVFQNVQEHRNTLFENLIRPLHHDSKRKLDEITRYKIAEILDQSIRYAELALQAALKREQQKDTVIRLLQEISDNRHYVEEDLLMRATSFKGEVRIKLENIVLPYQPQITGKISSLFSSSFYEWKGTLNKVSRKFEKWLKETLENEITTLDKERFEQVNQIVKETVVYYGYAALQFRQRLDEKLHQAFGIHLPEASWQIEFAGIDKPDISIYRAFDSHLEMVLFFLPMKLSNKIFFKHFQKQIPYEIEKNLYRFISDLTGKIIIAIDSIYKQSLQFISYETKTIERILQGDKNNCAELENNLKRLKEIKITSQKAN